MLVFRVFCEDSNLRKEPKFIVFFTQLLAIFKFCHVCKFDNPLVEVQENGTMAEVPQPVLIQSVVKQLGGLVNPI